LVKYVVLLVAFLAGIEYNQIHYDQLVGRLGQ